MTEQTIVAVYDTPAHAELAVQDLLQAGVPESAVHRHAQDGSYAGRQTTPVRRSEEGTGFWASLFGGEPDHDTTVYDRSVQGGANAVTVKVSDEHATKVVGILEQHRPIDIDERAGSYGLVHDTSTSRPAGLAGTDRTGAEKLGTEKLGTEKPGLARAVTDKLGLGGTGDAVRRDERTRGTDGGTIQLSEETLNVGKRVVNQGTTRVRRFVVETPVEQSVSLHDERVVLERHKVTDGRPAGDAFSERTIEMSETAEEAVVNKTARVTEEINLRKEGVDRTETVRDTVRREDVEIEKLPGNKPAI